MTNTQLKTLFNHINKIQAIIYKNDDSFQETFFADSYNDQTYIAEISFGDHLIFVKLGHLTEGAWRNAEIDSEDFAEWLQGVANK